MSDRDVPATEKRIRLALFVAPNTHASTLAASHLRHALASYDPQTFDLEIVDVFTEPRRLLREGILVTPTLLEKGLGQRVIGDLSNASLLDYFLESLFRLHSDQT